MVNCNEGAYWGEKGRVATGKAHKLRECLLTLLCQLAKTNAAPTPPPIHPYTHILVSDVIIGRSRFSFLNWVNWHQICICTGYGLSMVVKNVSPISGYITVLTKWYYKWAPPPQSPRRDCWLQLIPLKPAFMIVEAPSYILFPNDRWHTREFCSDKTNMWEQNQEVKTGQVGLLASYLLEQPTSQLTKGSSHRKWSLSPLKVLPPAQIVLSTFTNLFPIKLLNNLGNA